MKTEHGIEKGEVCNRDDCQGIIDEHDTDSCCSCHISPPCSYCTDSREYCPVCNWDGREEQIQEENKIRQVDYRQCIDSFFKVRTMDDLDKSKIDYLSMSHTHFSMRKKGVFPKGTTKNEVEQKVKGSFGGRFKSFNEDTCTFEYIAYTD